MSLFRSIEATCPSCQVPGHFDLVHSVNADRRPALREEILKRTFQQSTCPACGERFRIAPELTYVHQAQGLWLSIWPADNLERWPDSEARARKAFALSFGPEAGPAAAALGAELKARAVFGWEAACEKIIATEVGIDDVELELAKIALFRSIDGLSPGEDVELRLLGVDAQGLLHFGLYTSGAEALREEVHVPREVLDEIAADAGWQSLREQLRAGLFVDSLRLMIEPA